MVMKKDLYLLIIPFTEEMKAKRFIEISNIKGYILRKGNEIIIKEKKSKGRC